MPAEITALRLWQRYAGTVWDQLQDDLRSLPVEHLATSSEILCAAMQNVSLALRSSLETIGLRFEESPTGPNFYVIRSDFPESEATVS